MHHMLISSLFIGFAAASPVLSWSQIPPMTVMVHAQAQILPPSTKPKLCLDGTRSDEVYMISNLLGVCGTNSLAPCTRYADKVNDLCDDTCINAVDATTGKPANIYGLSHPRQDGGFFTLYNGTNCEPGTMYLKYRAQMVGTGPVRYVQTTHIKPMEVSPFMSFRYSHTRD